MAKILPRLRCSFSRILQFSECKYSQKFHPALGCSFIRQNHFTQKKDSFYSKGYTVLLPVRTYVQNKDNELVKECDKQKPTLFQRFKSMYKDYWYVLIPVHVVTSIGWFGGFYYMAVSGVDIVGLLESLNVSEKIIDSMRNSQMGYFAIAYACYKIATPARYTVTLGGTTISINYLKKWGYIKPVPSAEKLKKLYMEKRETFDKTMREKKDDLKAKKEEFMAKKDEIKSKIDERLEKGMNKIEELKDKTEAMKEKAGNILKEKK